MNALQTDIQRQIAAAVRCGVLLLGLALMAVVGTVVVLVPVALGILSVERQRAKEWARSVRRFLLRLNPLVGKAAV